MQQAHVKTQIHSEPSPASLRTQPVEPVTAASVAEMLTYECPETQIVFVKDDRFRHVLQSSSLVHPTIAKLPVFRDPEQRIEATTFEESLSRNRQIVCRKAVSYTHLT